MNPCKPQKKKKNSKSTKAQENLPWKAFLPIQLNISAMKSGFQKKGGGGSTREL